MDLIYQDENYIAVNKPSGLLSTQDGYQKDLPNARALLEQEFGRLWTVHRLDKDTSGVLVFALNPMAHKLLNDQFEQRNVKKEYRALVTGQLTDEEFEITIPLRINGDRRHRTVPDPDSGKDARTEIKYKKSYRSASVLSVHPLTGYTHQIRSHLFFSGYPIVGDTLYRNPRIEPSEFSDFPRLALHALSIGFLHPFDHQFITITSSIPSEISFLGD